MSIMTGKLKDLTINRDGSQNITLTVQSDFRETFDELFDGEIDVEIKKHSKRRSMDMNNLCWALIDQIAAKLQKKKSEVYREAIKDIGGVSEIYCGKDAAIEKLASDWTSRGLGWQAVTEKSKLPGCTNITLYYGSSVYNTQQMSALIESLIQDCNALGIPTMAQKEIDRALELWGKKQAKKQEKKAGEE